MCRRPRARLPQGPHGGLGSGSDAEAGLVKGERIGVDASTMEANAALRNIVRRDTGEGYRGMLARLAQESGIETPTAEDLARLDRKRKGKKLSNQDWVSKSDPEAKIAKMKDGTTHLAYKPEHAVDLVAAELHPADEGDTTTLEKTLAAAKENLDGGRGTDGPRPNHKGYHSRSVLLDLRAQAERFCARTATGRPAGQSPTTGRAWPSLQAVETTSIAAASPDMAARARERAQGLHVAGHNLSLLMRKLIGAGTPGGRGGRI